MLNLVVGAVLQAGTSELTVYNQGIGFVKERREVSLKPGRQSVVIEDVAQKIDASSVGFKCLSNDGSVSILEQNYRFDLLSPNAILEKSVGKRIRFTRAGTKGKESVEGVLMSSPTAQISVNGMSQWTANGLVIRTDDGRIMLSPRGEIEVLELPNDMISKPSLVWDLDSGVGQLATMELSYLTKGISWSSNYVLTLRPSGKADLQGWATVNNQSGIDYHDAKLNLMAGVVNLVQDSDGVLEFRDLAKREQMDPAVKPASLSYFASEQQFFEYHQYSIPFPSTVLNNEAKQLALLEGRNVSIKKVVQVDFETDVVAGDRHATARLKFTNDKKSNLGMPMPAGNIRVMSEDKNGSMQFLGEDSIEHTPKDEKVDIKVGDAFDVVGSYKQVSKKTLSAHLGQIVVEMQVRNRKATAENVTVIDHHPSGYFRTWKITQSADSWTKDKNGRLEFDAPLPANGVKTIRYTVEGAI